MGKQYIELTYKDIEFIKEQKIFYLASSSGDDVNLSPKGYDSLRVLDKNKLVFLDYPGSGNRTYRDTQNNGEFTILFNAFEGKAKILRLFCKSKVIKKDSKEFQSYLDVFKEKKALVRNFFLFEIYGVESSCGDAVPYMEYKGERESLKDWAYKMNKNDKLETYIEDHLRPPNMKKL